MGRKELVGGVGALLAVLTAIGGAAVAADAPARLPPAVAVEERRLSVRLTRVPLAQVLDLILERSDAELTVLGDIDGEVTATFDDLPLEQGLRRLLGTRSYVLVYVPEGPGPPPGSRVKIASGSSGHMAAREGTSVRPHAAAPLPGPVAEGPLPNPDLLVAVEAGGRGASAAERARFLERVLTTEADATIRSVALKTLTAVSPSSLAAIARTAQQDPSADVRRRALELLVVNGQQHRLVMDTLLAVAGTDPDGAVREQAMLFARNLDPSLP